MTPDELDQQLRLILAQLELVSTASTAAYNPGGGKTGDDSPLLPGSKRTHSDFYRARLTGVEHGRRRRLNAAEATGDEEQRAEQERRAHRIAHEQREQVLADAQREWRQLTGRDGEAPRERAPAGLDTAQGVEKAIAEEAPGKPADDVAAKLGLTVFSVRRRYVALGLDPQTGEQLPSEGDDRVSRVAELHAKGLTTRQIATLLRIHQTQVVRDIGRAA